MKTYSTAEIAKILKVRPAWIRAQAHRTPIIPSRNNRGHYLFSFQDIILLRATRSLAQPDKNTRKVHAAFTKLSRTLPAETSLSALRFERIGDRILAGDASNTWDPYSGQTQLPFEPSRIEQVTKLDLPKRNTPDSESTVEEWFTLALEHENNESRSLAEHAYRQVCKLDLDHVNARINLGRLRHAANALEEAECLYREALQIEPRHAIALFNLGVVLEDRGDNGSAIQCYKLSIDADSDIAEAHYNLARLYVKQSEETQAIRHYSRYKALIRNKDH